MWLPSILVVLLAVGYSQSQYPNYGQNQGQNYGHSQGQNYGQSQGNSQQAEPVDWQNPGIKTGASRGRVQSQTPSPNYNPQTSDVGTGEPLLQLSGVPELITRTELLRRLANAGYPTCTDHTTLYICYTSTMIRQDFPYRLVPSQQNPNGPNIGNTMTTTETYQPHSPVTNSEFGSSHDGLNNPTPRPSYNQQPSVGRPGGHLGAPQTTWEEYERTLTAAGYTRCVERVSEVICWSPRDRVHVTLPHYRQNSNTNIPQPHGGSGRPTAGGNQPAYGQTPDRDDSRQPFNERPTTRPGRPNQGNSGYGTNPSRPRTTNSPRPNYGTEPEGEEHHDDIPLTTTDRNQFINTGLGPGGSSYRPQQRPAQPGRRPPTQYMPSPDRQPDIIEPDSHGNFEPQTTSDRYQPNINQGGSTYDRPRQPDSGSSTGINRNPSQNKPTRPPHYSSDHEFVQQPERPTYEDFVQETTTERYVPSKGGSAVGERRPADRPRPSGGRRPGQQGSDPIGVPLGVGLEPETENLDVTAQVADATCQFSLDVFKTVAKTPGNVLMSPLSVQTLLAMLQQGAKQRSSQQLNNVLHVSPGVSKAGYAAVIKEYQKHSNELLFASKMFVNPNFRILPQFSKDLIDHFKTEATPLSQSSGAAQVNEWVKTNTKNRITELVRPGDITARTQLVLANVIHFKAQWLRTFDEAETRVKKFHAAPNEHVDVHMMQNEGLFYGGRDDDLGAQWVDMLYDNNDRDFSMLVVLPTEPHGLDLVIEKLTVGHLKKMIEPTITYNVLMEFPRFKLRSDTSFKSVLMQLGLTDVFDQRSHLEGVSTRTPLVVTQILHSAEIEVTEDGTEAAGASALYGNALTIHPHYPDLAFNVTQPFLAVIVDKIHKMPLFMARVTNPGLFPPPEHY